VPKRTYIRSGGTWVDITSGAAFPASSAAPASPVTGQVYFDTDDQKPYIWNGTAWVAFLPLSSATPTSIAATSAVGSGTVPSREDHVHEGVTSITGTASQVIASAADGPVTLSLPQSIATTSTPTFGATTINGIITGNKSGHSGVNRGVRLTATATTVTTITQPGTPTTTNTQLISWSAATTADTGMWTSGGSITLPLAGLYTFSFGSRFGTGTAYSMGVYAFQGTTLLHHVTKDASSVGALDNIEMTGTLTAAASDTFSIRVAATAASKSLSANTFLSVVYLGSW